MRADVVGAESLVDQPSAAVPSPASDLLALYRDRAERIRNAVRCGVLVLLASAALAYRPTLTPSLNRVNVFVLVPTLLWTLLQYLLFYRRERLPSWLSVANPIADITCITVIIGGYALAHSTSLALKSPMFLAYFVILAALPMCASTSKAALVSVIALAEYAVLVAVFIAGGLLPLVESPLAASVAPGVSPLDEGAKFLFLGVAGAVATYATNWQERLMHSFSRATEERQVMEARLARAQLQSLKLQLHPHFLFNTLNTITALINTDRHAAERVVSGLSELLRLSLSNVGEQEVPLSRELEILEHYIGIQQIRFQDRLRVSFDIDPEARNALVPNLVLQPLVENAIRHGIAPRASPGRIEVQATRRDGTLAIRVMDDGVGEDPRRPRHDGVGLGNTRARLRSLYGDDHRFEASGRPGGGFAVSIDIPYRAEFQSRLAKEQPA